MAIQRDLTLISITKLNLLYLKLHIIFSFYFYLKPLLQLSFLKPLACNWELYYVLLFVLVYNSLLYPFSRIFYYYQNDCCINRLMTRFIIFSIFLYISLVFLKPLSRKRASNLGCLFFLFGFSKVKIYFQSNQISN